MHIYRKLDQVPETLREFYVNLGVGADEGYERCGQMMVALLDYLEQQPGSPRWGYTSHHTLCIVNKNAPTHDDDDNRRLGGISIDAWAGIYQLQYGWFYGVPPWSNAGVVGRTYDVAEAGQMILTVLEEPARCSDVLQREATPSESVQQVDPELQKMATPMKLRRISAQQPETLEAFYTQLGQHRQPFLQKHSQAMLELIRYLENYHIGTDLWAYTPAQSLIRWRSPLSGSLILTQADTEDRGIEIVPIPHGYVIEYPISKPETLWQHGYAEGQALSVTRAAQMIKTAIHRFFYGSR